MRSFDVIVLGLGGVGSAACHHLTRRGARVLGLEQFGLAHALGSSHGETRLSRKSYLAAPAYIPLLHESEAWWERIERDAGRRLFHRVGLVVSGAPGSALVPRDAEAEAAKHGVTVEALDPREARGAAARFPGLRIPEGNAGYFEPGAGFLAVESCVEAYCALADKGGAALRFDEPALAWSSDGEGVAVSTVKDVYRAGALVVAAGAWSASILGELGVPLTVQRIPQTWFAGDERHEASRGMPCYVFDFDGGHFYGAPAVTGRRVKVCGARRAREVVSHPSKLDRRLREDDWIDARAFIDACLPGVSRAPIDASMCMCTMTPDERILLGEHPSCSRVFFAAGLSGHGFKFIPALAEALADLVFTGRAPEAMDFLRPSAPPR